jgi:uncharacterized metal-binding protein (TIGR02443 family)
MSKGFIRFIAGAICPSCKEQDKIAISPDDNTIYCLNCDFKEHRPIGPSETNAKTSNPKIFNLDDFRNKNS